MYGFLDDVAGYPAISEVVSAPTNLKDLPIVPGFLAKVFDPVFGVGEMIFARANGSIRLFGVCVCTPVWDSTNQTYTMNMTEVPNTANLARSVYVYQGTTALTAGQYGWFMTTGITPVNGTASVAADTAVGITAAGQIGAVTAGKTILGARCAQAATATVVKAGTGKSGDTWIDIPAGTQGMFAGGYMSGAGVGASAIVAQVDPFAIKVTVANSANIAGNVTQTNNNATIFYNTVRMNRAVLTATTV